MYTRKIEVTLGVWALLIALSACGAPVTSLPTSAISPTLTVNPAISTPEPAFTKSVPTTTLMVTPTLAPTVSATPSPVAIISLDNVERVRSIGRPVVSQWKIAQLVFRPDATWVAEPLEVGGIEFRDFHTRQVVNTLAEAGPDIELLIVSANGSLLAAVSPTQETVSVWDLERFTRLVTFAFKGYHTTQSSGFIPLVGNFSLDNRYLAVAGCLEVKYDQTAVCQNSGTVIYDLNAQVPLQVLNGYQYETLDAIFSINSELLVFAGEGESVARTDLLVWDVSRKEQMAAQQSGDALGFMALSFNSQGNVLASITTDNVLIFWDAETWQAKKVLNEGRAPNQIAYLPRDILFVSTDHSAGITFWSSEMYQPLHTIDTYIGTLYDLAISPDGRYVYTWSDDLSGLYKIQEWGIP